MLESTNAATRIGAAEAIDWDLYLDRSDTNLIDAELIQQTASKASQLLQSDKDPIVRLASIDVLKELNNWSNTIPALLSDLADKNDMVRVRVITALQRVCRQRGQPVGTNVVAALIEYLQSGTNSGVLCEAIMTTGELGKEADPTIIVLERLSGNNNKEIRACASEALQKLRPVRQSSTQIKGYLNSTPNH